MQNKGFASIILIAIAIGILTVLGVLVFFTGKLKNSSQTTLQSPNPVAVSEKSTNTDTKTAIPVNTIIPLTSSALSQEDRGEYVGRGFTFTIPKDWIVIESTFAEGGKTALFKPKSLPSDEYYPSISVVTTNYSLEKLKQQQDIFIRLGFKTSDIFFHGIQATKLKGSLSVRLAPTDQERTKTQETQYYFINNKISYQVKYKYIGTANNEDIEKLFAHILTSFTFVK